MYYGPPYKRSDLPNTDTLITHANVMKLNNGVVIGSINNGEYNTHIDRVYYECGPLKKKIKDEYGDGFSIGGGSDIYRHVDKFNYHVLNECPKESIITRISRKLGLGGRHKKRKQKQTKRKHRKHRKY